MIMGAVQVQVMEQEPAQSRIGDPMGTRVFGLCFACLSGMGSIGILSSTPFPLANLAS